MDEYKKIYADVWNFHKKYCEVKATDEYWEQAIDEGDRICRRYGNGRFVRDLVLSVLNEFERIYKKGDGII